MTNPFHICQHERDFLFMPNPFWLLLRHVSVASESLFTLKCVVGLFSSSSWGVFELCEKPSALNQARANGKSEQEWTRSWSDVEQPLKIFSGDLDKSKNRRWQELSCSRAQVAKTRRAAILVSHLEICPFFWLLQRLFCVSNGIRMYNSRFIVPSGTAFHWIKFSPGKRTVKIPIVRICLYQRISK